MIMVKLAKELTWEEAKNLRLPGAVFITRAGSDRIHAIKSPRSRHGEITATLKEKNLLTD